MPEFRLPTANAQSSTEIRSEEVQEILTKVPHWLIRYGILVIFILILGIISISWFVKYPDKVIGKALISTETPPLYISSQVSGRIVEVYVKNGQIVEEGQPLALIDNPIPANSINQIKAFLDSVDTIEKSESGYCHITELPEVNLYEATNDYLSLKNVLKELCLVQNDSYTNRKLASLKAKHKNYQKYLKVNAKEIELSRLDIANAKERFQMLKREFNLGITSKLNYLDAQSAYNQALKSEESLKKNEIQLSMTLNDYQDQILDFIHSQEQEEKANKQKLKELVEKLKNHIVRWDNDFLIKSPARGSISFLERVFENQQVEPGAAMVAVIPEESEFEVILDLPVTGFGKIKEGQQVKLKVDNFPASEFGSVRGVIRTLPSLPKDDVYRVRVELPDRLTTSYNQELVYQPEMTATAEVITEDLRLIERLFYQLRGILN